MRRITLLKTVFVALALIAGNVGILGQVVISQIYGGGGNSGATLKNDFIELYNRGTVAVSLNGWSVQYTSATGAATIWSTTNSTNLPNVMLNPGQYYLIQELAGNGGTTNLPTPDVTGTISLAAGAGKVALCNNTTPLTTTDFTSTSPTGSAIIDFVGFGTTANCYEGTGPTGVPSATLSVFRVSGGLVDTNNNSADFITGIANPRNSSVYQSTTSAASPSFSIGTGMYNATQNVALSSITTGAKIYYSIDGTDPNNTGNGTLYASPIAVNSTTTIKAIAYDASGASPSGITSATYTFPTIVANINALRSATISGFYQLTGQSLLTFQDAVGKVKFIQDGTAGIIIYDGIPKITTTYAIGDKIPNIYCTLSLYNGMLELIPFADPGAAVSSGNIVTPTIVTLANIANYIGQLVTVKNVAITGTGNFVASTTAAPAYLALNDGAAGYLRVAYTDLPYVATPIPATNQDITGVVNMYTTTEADLIPRTAADMVITTVTAINQASTNSGIYASNGNVVFTATAGQTVEIFNAVGQRLLQKQAVAGLNTIPVSTKGVLLVKVDNRIAKVIL